jgi:aldehyde:ferredoxin oxidoreductase
MGGCPSHCEVRCGNGMRYEGSVMELNLEQQHYERDKD